jgi:hypothetical protein
MKNGSPITGASFSSYTTPTTTTADSGISFSVEVSNSIGSVTSGTAKLTVNASAVAPAIVSQPTSQAVTVGQPATFKVAADGTAPLNYQWLKNGVNIPGANSPTYTTPAASPSDNGTTHQVVVSNAKGSVTSSPAKLIVDQSAIAPTMTAQPLNETVTVGQTATFSVVANGTAPLNYQWQKNGINISGATSPSYTTPATTAGDNGSTYAVVISNSSGTVTSNPASLTVSVATVAPSITSQPTSQTVTAGQIATFSVTASGTAPLNYQWQKNGANISGATSSSYTTPATTSGDSGSVFQVVVTNTKGSVTSNSASLTVASATVAPSITAQPVNQTVSAGQTATFMAAANGTAPLSYQWQKNGANISGATFSNYTTPVTTTADTGSTYRLVVSNAKGTATSNSATLTVSAAAVAPSITSQPSGQTVTSGQTATFTASANGTAPLNYQWQKNGSNISGATSSSYTTPATTTADSGSTFRVVVNNSAGTATSNSAALTVNGAAVAPSITSQPSNQTVTAGQTATYTVAASGTAPLAYQWQKDGSNIGGATSPSYTTPATTSGDSGSTYRAVVSNSAGTATSNLATLTVNAAAVAPTITTQPTNQTVTAGQTATFTIAASGTAPLAYQWQKDGTNISGGTMASYTTSATTTADSGSAYRALVSNSIGTATSNSATLTVNSGTLKSYKTNFPLAENPISESGHWINGGTDGLDWGNVQVGANHVYGTNLPSIYGDPTAVLTGSWSSDQQAQGTVSVNTSQPNCCHEVELRLRTTITAHSITGYEINCSVSSGSPYVQIVRWNGPLASFAYVNTTGSTGCVNGDIFKATIVGSTITVYKNGNQVLQGIDSTFTSGSPGVGFYDNQDSNWSDFGFSSFTATEISGAP